MFADWRIPIDLSKHEQLVRFMAQEQEVNAALICEIVSLVQESLPTITSSSTRSITSSHLNHEIVSLCRTLSTHCRAGPSCHVMKSYAVHMPSSCRRRQSGPFFFSTFLDLLVLLFNMNFFLYLFIRFPIWFHFFSSFSRKSSSILCISWNKVRFTWILIPSLHIFFFFLLVVERWSSPPDEFVDLILASIWWAMSLVYVHDRRA